MTPERDCYVFEYDGKARDVHTVGPVGQRSVVLMHELAGLSPVTENLAELIAARGFQVHLPVLFGKHGQRNRGRGTWRVICMRREFANLADGRRSPLADWMRALCRHVMWRSADRPVGVMGMCVTGGLAIACALEPTVAAAVSAQPSLPLPVGRAQRPSLGLTVADERAARGCETPVMGLRFRHDLLCPRVRLETLEQTFPEARVRTLPESGTYRQHGIRVLAHATLTYDASSDVARAAREEVLSFLDRHVGAVP